MRKIKIFFGLLVIMMLQQERLGAQELYTIEKTLEVAYLNSPDIISQKLTLDSRRENVNATKADLKSKFSLTVEPIGFTKTRNYEQLISQWTNYKNISSSGTFSIVQPIKATDGTITLSNEFGYANSTTNDNSPEKYFSNDILLKISQPLLKNYNSNKMGLRQAELELENALLQFAILKLNTENMVSQYFYQVYQAQQSLVIAKEELDNQQKSHNIIKNKVEAGLTAEEELWQAELNLANAESTVNDKEVSLENAKDQLKQYIGLSLNADFNLLANIDVKTIDVKLEDAIAYAIHQRMELRQNEIDIETSRMSLVQTKDDDKINGTVDLSVGLFGNDKNFGQIYDASTDNESVALSFNIPIWDWGARKSRIKIAENTVKSSEISFDQEKVSIELEIRQTYRNLKNLIYQIDIAKKNVENAQKTYELNLEKYENGDLTSMDLSLYQNQLSTQKNSLTSALINYKLGLLNLKIQTLWDFETGKSVLPDIHSPEFGN